MSASNNPLGISVANVPIAEAAPELMGHARGRYKRPVPRGILNVRSALAGLLALVLLVCSSGCQSSATIQQAGSKAALAGQQLCDAAITTYTALAQMQQVDREQQGFLNAMSGIARVPTTTSFSLEIESRVRAYNALKETYQAFASLSQTDSGGQVKQATQSLETSIGAIRQLPKLPDAVGQLLPDLAALATSQIQAGEIKKHSRIMFDLEKAYQALWDADRPIWTAYINKVRSTYADSVISIPDTVFDQRALADTMKTPYVTTVTMALYKQQLASMADVPVNQIIQNMDNVTKAFGALRSAHGELQQPSPALANIDYALNTALSLLKDVQLVNKQTDGNKK